MRISINQNDPFDQLGKEFWGILLFEWSLPALHHYFALKSMAVGLSRFADWIVFPDKLPIDEQKRWLQQLQERDPADPTYKDYTMSPEEMHLHHLVCELLQLKYSGESLSTSSLYALYQTPFDVFYQLSIQMVERGWISSRYMAHLYTQYKYLRKDVAVNDER